MSLARHSTLILFLLVLTLAAGIFWQWQKAPQAVLAVAQEQMMPEADWSGDLVCDEVIPIGNAFSATKLLVDDIFQEYRTAQVNLDAAIRNITGQLALLTSTSNRDDVCDPARCAITLGPRNQARDQGADFDLNLDTPWGKTFRLAGLHVAMCKKVQCAGAPCNDLSEKIANLKIIKDSFEVARHRVHEALYSEAEYIGYDLLLNDAEDPSDKISRPDKVRREIQLVRNWLTPATGLRKSCAMSASDRAKADAGTAGQWGPMKCSDAREVQAYWPRSWSEKCVDKCVDDNDLTKECRECLGDWHQWSKVDYWLAEKNLANEGSLLAQINFVIYDKCKGECADTLDDKCVKCLCTKGVRKNDYTEEECTAWLYGGSNNNWTCCRERGVSRLQLADLANFEFTFPTLTGDIMMRAREVLPLIKQLVEADNAGNKVLKNIDPVYVLGVLATETGIGSYLGGPASTAKMKGSQLIALGKIIAGLEGKTAVDQATIDKYPVSQSSGDQSGGAMGPMQIMPVTWSEVKNEIPRALGIVGPANPWTLEHSLVGGMTYLVVKCGADSDQDQAARKYIAGPSGNISGVTASNYAGRVMGYKVCFQQAIDLGCFKPDAEQTDEIKQKCKANCAKL